MEDNILYRDLNDQLEGIEKSVNELKKTRNPDRFEKICDKAFTFNRYVGNVRTQKRGAENDTERVFFHEFGAPLTVLTGFSSLYRYDSPDPNGLKEFLTFADSSIHTLKNLSLILALDGMTKEEIGSHSESFYLFPKPPNHVLCNPCFQS